MIEKLLAERASAMAAHDGVPVGAVHIHGAAGQLQAELLRARDALMRPAPAKAAAARSAAAEPARATADAVPAAITVPVKPALKGAVEPAEKPAPVVAQPAQAAKE